MSEPLPDDVASAATDAADTLFADIVFVYEYKQLCFSFTMEELLSPLES